MRAVAREFTVAGLGADLRETHAGLGVTAVIRQAGRQPAEIALCADGRAELRWQSDPTATLAEVAATLNRVLVLAAPPSVDSIRLPAKTSILDGRRLRQLRREHGLSIERLAWKAGISITTVARLESQPHPRCRDRTLARLAAALDEDPAAITSRAWSRTPQAS
jgi:DNA-binding XRE family transcriptional regulator